MVRGREVPAARAQVVPAARAQVVLAREVLALGVMVWVARRRAREVRWVARVWVQVVWELWVQT